VKHYVKGVDDLPSDNDINCLWNCLPKDYTLTRFVVDLLAWNWVLGEDNFKVNDSGGLPRDMYVLLFRSRVGFRGGNPREAGHCQYHEHSTDDEKRACEAQACKG